MQEFMHIYLSIRAIIVPFHNKFFAPPILYPFSTLSQLSVSNSFCLTHAGSEFMRVDLEKKKTVVVVLLLLLLLL